MKRLRIGISALVLSIVGAAPQPVWAILPLPTTLCGTAQLDQAAIADGIELSAWYGPNQIGQSASVTEGGDSVYCLTRPHLLSLAQRIIRRLSVQRLTMSDVNVPIGVTAQELRDTLCLWALMPAGVASDRPHSDRRRCRYAQHG